MKDLTYISYRNTGREVGTLNILTYISTCRYLQHTITNTPKHGDTGPRYRKIWNEQLITEVSRPLRPIFMNLIGHYFPLLFTTSPVTQIQTNPLISPRGHENWYKENGEILCFLLSWNVENSWPRPPLSVTVTKTMTVLKKKKINWKWSNFEQTVFLKSLLKGYTLNKQSKKFLSNWYVTSGVIRNLIFSRILKLCKTFKGEGFRLNYCKYINLVSYERSGCVMLHEIVIYTEDVIDTFLLQPGWYATHPDKMLMCRPSFTLEGAKT